MKKILTIIFLILSFFNLSFSQPLDSLVRFSELTFNSDFEEQYFERLFAKQDEHILLPLFLAADPGTTASTLKSVEGKMAGIYSELDNAGLEKKNEAKK